MRKQKVLRYRTKDVGRPGHHYVTIAVLKGKGVRGGRTVGRLVTKAQLKSRVNKARRKWMSMSSKARKRAMPERKGRTGYKKKRVVKRSVKGKKYYSYVWEKKYK